MELQIPYAFEPREYQLQLFASMEQAGEGARAFLRWHRRAGKDKACWCYMIYKAALVAGNYYYVFPTAAQGRKALWETTDKDGFAAIDHIPKGYGAEINSQEMRIILPTVDGKRSVIRIVGLDKNKDGIRGVSCKGAVFSEFAYQDADAYKTLMPSLRESGGWCIFNSTPQGNNHMWEMEQNVLKAIEEKKDTRWYFSHLQVLHPDKPNYSGLLTPKDMIEIQDEEGLTDDDMEREYGASYDSGIKGGIYTWHVEKAKEEGRVGLFPYDSNFPVHTAWDFGFSTTDPTSIWVYQYINDTIRFIDFFEEYQTPIPQLVSRVLSSKEYDYVEHNLPHDSENNLGYMQSRSDLLREALRANGLKPNVRFCPKQSVKLGIEAVQSRFSRYHFNASTCAAGLDKISLYHNKWDPRRRVFLKEPVHDENSHAADALRTEALASSDRIYKIPKEVIRYDTDFDLFE